MKESVCVCVAIEIMEEVDDFTQVSASMCLIRDYNRMIWKDNVW